MIGSGEILVILAVILLLFGGKKLPEFAKNLGKGIREFKKAFQGIDDEIIVPSPIEKQDEKNLTISTQDSIKKHE